MSVKFLTFYQAVHAHNHHSMHNCNHGVCQPNRVINIEMQVQQNGNIIECCTGIAGSIPVRKHIILVAFFATQLLVRYNKCIKFTLKISIYKCLEQLCTWTEMPKNPDKFNLHSFINTCIMLNVNLIMI
jgi:hypothetical protein